jgi:hypothetical protein
MRFIKTFSRSKGRDHFQELVIFYITFISLFATNVLKGRRDLNMGFL